MSETMDVNDDYAAAVAARRDDAANSASVSAPQAAAGGGQARDDEEMAAVVVVGHDDDAAAAGTAAAAASSPPPPAEMDCEPRTGGADDKTAAGGAAAAAAVAAAAAYADPAESRNIANMHRINEFRLNVQQISQAEETAQREEARRQVDSQRVWSMQTAGQVFYFGGGGVQRAAPDAGAAAGNSSSSNECRDVVLVGARGGYDRDEAGPSAPTITPLGIHNSMRRRRLQLLSYSTYQDRYDRCDLDRPHPWDLSAYKNRLNTFKTGWVLHFITPRQMAKAGFYFLGVVDRVRCTYCTKEYDFWQEDEDPIEVHKIISPNCEYVNQKNQVFDICGTFESLIGHHVPNNEFNMIQYFLKTVGIVHQVNVLFHNKTLTSFDSRYKTFDNCRILHPDKYTLCKSGYYYTGQSDETICFCCNQGLKEWEHNDDPWVEHARWSPTCSFVLLSKGKNFVEEVGGEVNNNLDVDMEELCRLITVKTNYTVYDSSLSNLLPRRRRNSKRIDHRVVKKMMPDFNDYIVQQHPATLPDSMLCKICFKEKLEVLLLPCGHIIACIQCAVTIEQCAICRLPFDLSLRVYIYPTDIMQENTACDVVLKPQEFYSKPVQKPACCKLCYTNEIKLVFLPCRHGSTCYKCGFNLKECPVCFERVYAFIEVFL